MNSHGEEIPVVNWTKILYYKEGNYKDFVKRFLSYTHDIFIGKKSNRIPKELRNFLSLSPKVKIGDWFLFRNHT
jgi:hypothetical protein